MFAPTAPPPTREEYEAQYRAGAPAPSPEPYSPPQAGPYGQPQSPGPYAQPPAPYPQPQAAPPPLAPLPHAGSAGAPHAYSPQAPQPQPSQHSTFSSPGAGRDPDHVEPGALRVLAGFLVSYDQADLGLFWPLYQGQNLVGRKGAAPGLDIEIDHPTTSSRHAVLYASARPARLKVEDNGSTNGTFLGEQRLDRGRRHELRDGDVVRFGAFAAVIKLV